jgi:hypothetical protein
MQACALAITDAELPHLFIDIIEITRKLKVKICKQKNCIYM